MNLPWGVTQEMIDSYWEDEEDTFPPESYSQPQWLPIEFDDEADIPF